MTPAASPDSPSMKDVMNLMKESMTVMGDTFKTSLETVANTKSKTEEGDGTGEEGPGMKEVTPDKFFAITGLDSRRKAIVLHDNDPDLDTHILRFENQLACHNWGKQKQRDIDQLHMFGNTFNEGGIRHKVNGNS